MNSSRPIGDAGTSLKSPHIISPASNAAQATRFEHDGGEKTEPRIAPLPVATNDACPISVSLLEVGDLDEARELWLDLQARSRHSFFNSWGWIGCWLSQLPVAIRPQLLVAENASGIVGLAFVGRKRLRRGGIIRSNARFLHETGDPLYDSLTIEHNGLLADRDCEAAVHHGIVDFLNSQCRDWDELMLSGIDSNSSLARVVQNERAGGRLLLLKQSPCYVVDLDELRNSGKDFCSSLGSSTRASVRKSIRLYEERGALTLQQPRDVSEALQFFEELKALHGKSWESRGDSGAFAHDWLDGFHRNLIAARFPHREIQLLRVQAGDHLIGLLYNFALDGRISFYQSGFQYEENAKLKPGLVCHTLAIDFNREQGAHAYDFLAGDGQYKRSLGREAAAVQWFVLQRNRWRFRVEDLLRAARARLRHLRTPAKPATEP
ncbi:MAG: GNAT family N-acetyltransferase [Planctomycetia bacterium]|nr:GNAT family N-acetyltransferase [Planctomycetia bacterium]